MELLRNQVLQAEQIMIGESKLAIYADKNIEAQALPFNLKTINVDDFRLMRTSVSYKDQKTGCSFTTAINFQKVNITSPDNDGFDFGSVSADLWDIRYSGPSYENVEINKLEFDSKKNIAIIKDIKIVPRLGKYELGARLGHQADWVNARISKIEIIKPNFQELLHKKIFADKVLIGESNAYIFRDRRLARSQKIMPLPANTLSHFLLTFV